ncbi:unnamed protein product [Caenorhabditis auriculariae]|uniref:Uncharacterized protein n=1 Tax=Caenorhabditis auriculariae TaxID=2777116 RepID=A0A8S1HBA1_9PELO|nr:unnamed protein product [Caenorhabditis auriculariae]
MEIIKLLVVLCFLQICSANYKNCEWVPTFACGGEVLSCIGRVKVGRNAHSSEEAKIVEKEVQEGLKPWRQEIIDAIKEYIGECSFDPKLSSLVQGQKLCCDFTL